MAKLTTLTKWGKLQTPPIIKQNAWALYKKGRVQGAEYSFVFGRITVPIDSPDPRKKVGRPKKDDK